MDRLGAQEGEVLTHPLITRSIEQAQKRVELQNFQARKRLLEYDDVMNQQREVIYSLRSFALEGGEELKGEALKMMERALERRVEKALSVYDQEEEWDFALLRQELMMHYLLQVPEFEEGAEHPRTIAEAQAAGRAAARQAFDAKIHHLNQYRAPTGQPAGEFLLSQIMLSVIDQKWKDHLYDLDQLRGAIHYRSWGQKDPLIEYKQEAYTMFVDLMGDVYNTFAENYLRVQLVFEEPQAEQAARRAPAPPRPAKPAKRYNALGILEDVPAGELDGASENGGEAGVAPAAGGDIVEAAYEGAGDGEPQGAMDVAPDQPPKRGAVARQDPVVVGAGRARTLGAPAPASGGKAAAPRGGAPVDWSAVGRNDPCPCGSGKKFKKCHGAQIQ
jgi:preprotein translocase subunit SecA